MYIINRVPEKAVQEKGYANYPEDFPHLNSGENFKMWRNGNDFEVESILTEEALEQRIRMEIKYLFSMEKNITEKLYEYLEQFIIQSDWLNKNVPEKARAIFTTMCFAGNIDADTSKCDNTLIHLYNVAVKELDITYEDFKNFMVELIV